MDILYSEHLSIKNKERWQVIVIDGVVGAGKSTLMKLVTEHFQFRAYEEPVTQNPILDRFYYDRARYAFPLQVYFLNQRFRQIKEASQSMGVLDRSIYGDLIFAKMLNQNQELSDEEFQIYLDLFDNMIEHCHPPKLMIYLEISTEQAMKHIRQRGREYEQHVDRTYWEALNQEYQQYFNQYNLSPLLKIRVGERDFKNNLDDQIWIFEQIREKISMNHKKEV